MTGCYLCEPDNPAADREEACEACDRAFFETPIVIPLDEGDL